MKSILLGILTYKYVTSIAYCNHMATLLDGVNCGLVKNLSIEADMYVTTARNNLCLTALNAGVTHLLMLDDDVLAAPGDIAKLAENDVPVVSGTYYTRDLRPVAYTFDPFEFLTDVPDSGVISVGGTGGGFLLISCEVLKQMQSKYGDPWWFQSQVLREEGGKETYLGEDVWFFKRLHEMGIAAYLDCNVQLGHAGTAVADRSVFELSQKIKRTT